MGATPIPKVPYHKLTYEDKREWVLRQVRDAYVEGKIGIERLELDIEAILNDKTPVDSEGWPVYYDPRILDYVNY